jgi:hypothetical protein
MIRNITLYLMIGILVTIFASGSYAVIGTQLIQNGGFENPISWVEVRDRGQLGQWGLPSFALNSEGIFQETGTVYAGSNSVGIPRRISEGRAIGQWVDISPCMNKNRIFSACWVLIPNAYAAQSWYVGTGRPGYLSNWWSTSTSSDLTIGAVLAANSPFGALPTWQPLMSYDLWIPDGYRNFLSSFYLDVRAGCPSDDFDNHFVDEFKVWVDDQVTEYKTVDFQQPAVLTMDTTPIAPGNADARETSDPWVIKDGDLYKMWYTGQGADTIFRICYATSTDGIHDWLRYGAVLSPIRNDPTYSYDSNRVLMPCVIKDIVGTDTTYKMWYSSWGIWTGDSNGWQRYRTGYATSPDGLSWTRQGIAMGIDTGLQNVVNSISAQAGRVIKVGGVYKMWVHDNGNLQIGYSESTDGINWNKPIHALERGAFGQDTRPVDTCRVYMCSPYYDSEAGVYHLWYTATTTTPHPYNICHAVSDDGLFWTKDSRNPVIDHKTIAEWDYSPHRMCVIRDGKKFKMWYTVYGTKDGLGALRIAYTEGTVESALTQISPSVISGNVGSSFVLYHSGGVAPVAWENSDTTAASIESTANNGRTVYVKANALGSAIFSATDFYGNTANALVNVVATGVPVYRENTAYLMQRREVVSELFE